VLLPDPDGKPSAITVTNAGGSQVLSDPYQATRVERNDAAPAAAFAMSSEDVRRIFGAALDALPLPEISFTLYFGGDSEVLLPESQALMPDILKAIRERRATLVTVIGHTDTTATPQYNYQLGLRRAQSVASILREQSVPDSALVIDSHGDADLAVPTERGVSERRNRRVEIVVR
jgi:outer membrane protein OmpA-like peptidoglycan-associated protein